MEQNLQVVARKFWKIVRVAFYMLRQGISKKKLMLDLNFMVKRRKLAGKAMLFLNLMFHHQSSSSSSAAPGEYEFSCSNSPAFPSLPFPFSLKKRKPNNNCNSHLSSSGQPPPASDEDTLAVNAAVMTALEMIHREAGSPAMPGFGRTPMVRQLRVTDSPFPVDYEDSRHVDMKAEEFISRFYSNLRKQNAVACLESC